jgi:hypothetical protein
MPRQPNGTPVFNQPMLDQRLPDFGENDRRLLEGD